MYVANCSVIKGAVRYFGLRLAETCYLLIIALNLIWIYVQCCTEAAVPPLSLRYKSVQLSISLNHVFYFYIHPSLPPSGQWIYPFIQSVSVSISLSLFFLVCLLLSAHLYMCGPNLLKPNSSFEEQTNHMLCQTINSKQLGKSW